MCQKSPSKFSRKNNNGVQEPTVWPTPSKITDIILFLSKSRMCVYTYDREERLVLLFATFFFNLQQPDLLQDEFNSRVVNSQHRFSSRFEAMFQNKLFVFVACFTVA